MWPEVFEPTQVGSFREKVHPPTTEPGDGPFVCVRFNKDWLPYVLGGLFQLINPSSWLVDDEPSLQEALERATALLDLFGQAGDCPPMDLRFTDGCVLQYSLDGGTTWLDVEGWTTNFPVCNPPQTQVKFDSDCLLTESFDGGETFEAVPGWSANFKDCVISNAPIIGLPPNPGDEEHDQFACSIASYLADQIILLAMQKAVNAIQDDLTLLVFGANVLTIIPEFILVAAAYDAFATIYGIVAEGTLAHYEAAIADTVLWQRVTCAIYSAILVDGYVTPGNYPTILTNLAAVSYTHSDVVDAIGSYVSSLGATGLAQLSQRAGLLVGSDCSPCTSTWCRTWDFTSSAYGFAYSGVNGGVYVAGVGWQSTSCSGTIQCLDFDDGFSGTYLVDSVQIEGTSGGASLSGLLFGDAALEHYINLGSPGAGAFNITADGPITVSSLRVLLNVASSGPKTTITRLTLRGHGAVGIHGDVC